MACVGGEGVYMRSAIDFDDLKDGIKLAGNVRSNLIKILRKVCDHRNIHHESYHRDGGWDCNGYHPDSGGWSKCPDCGLYIDWTRDGVPRHLMK